MIDLANEGGNGNQIISEATRREERSSVPVRRMSLGALPYDLEICIVATHACTSVQGTAISAAAAGRFSAINML